MSKRAVDDCPMCGESVEVVELCGRVTSVSPCGHRVTVTMWPDRVELARVSDADRSG